jgi:hypothetical protein
LYARTRRLAGKEMTRKLPLRLAMYRVKVITMNMYARTTICNGFGFYFITSDLYYCDVFSLLDHFHSIICVQQIKIEYTVS